MAQKSIFLRSSNIFYCLFSKFYDSLQALGHDVGPSRSQKNGTWRVIRYFRWKNRNRFYHLSLRLPGDSLGHLRCVAPVRCM